MPATEQTWRDQKAMHIVFGVSSVVMLISTLWMFGDDHNREWKAYQRTENKIETKMTEWRLVQEQSEGGPQGAQRPLRVERIDECQRADAVRCRNAAERA
jgi:hypothetical protein